MDEKGFILAGSTQNRVIRVREVGTGKWGQGTGGSKLGTGNWGQGTWDRELGQATWDRELGTGNWDRELGPGDLRRGLRGGLSPLRRGA